MKKKYLFLLLALGLVVAGAIGGTLAATSDSGVELYETISEKHLGVKDNSKIEDSLVVNPGSDTNVAYYVTNDGKESGYGIYAKVDIYLDWEQSNQGSSYGSFDDDNQYTVLSINTGDNNKTDYTAIPMVDSYKNQITIGDWIVAYANNEQVVLYYTKPIAQGDSSSEFLSRISFDKKMDNRYVGAKLSISTEVNAVQANSNISAIASEWGVFPTFTADSDGNAIISSVSEEE